MEAQRLSVFTSDSNHFGRRHLVYQQLLQIDASLASLLANAGQTPSQAVPENSLPFLCIFIPSECGQ